MPRVARPSAGCSLPSVPTPLRRHRRCARTSLAALLATTLLFPLSAAGRDVIVVELPPASCDVCAPGKPPPPAAVQDELRRFNREVNWRKQPQTGDTIPLGSATRIWFQRAWASGRLQSGVANLGGGAGGGRSSTARAGMRRQPRSSLAARSRSRLADRRSTRDEGRNSRSRRGRDGASSSSSGGTSSELGTNRSSSSFGNLGEATGMQ